MSSPTSPGELPEERPPQPGEQAAQTQAPGGTATPFPQQPYPPYPPYPYYPPQPPYGPPSGQYPPPYPPYPGYAPYPPGAYGAPNMPPMPKGRSRWPLWTGLGIGLFLVVLLACCGGVYFVYQNALAPSIGAGTAIGTFCVDEQTQNYAAAYSQLSQNLQSQISQSTFVSDNQQYDSTKGQVTNCQINTSGGSSVSGSTYTYTLNVTRDTTYSGVITIVKDGSHWRIDSIDPALPVT